MFELYFRTCFQDFDTVNFPLKEEIVFGTSSGTAPQYAATVSLETAKTEAGLDDSQQAALNHALTHRLAIIQGPPGCGKTLVGVRLVKRLVDGLLNGPVVVMTFKNRALDEFLVSLLDFLRPEDLVRVGSRSQEPRLDCCNLRNIRSPRPKLDLKSQISRMDWTVASLLRDLYEEGSGLTVVDLLTAWSEEQVRQFLLRGAVGGQNMDSLFAAESSVSQRLLSCAEGLCPTDQTSSRLLWKMFQQLLKRWLPPQLAAVQEKGRKRKPGPESVRRIGFLY